MAALYERKLTLSLQRRAGEGTATLATLDQIKLALKRKQLVEHPDKGGSGARYEKVRSDVSKSVRELANSSPCQLVDASETVMKERGHPHSSR